VPAFSSIGTRSTRRKWFPFIPPLTTFESDAKPVGFSRESDGVDIAGRLQSWQSAGDQQFWKLIVSPEFGDRADLSRLTRELIKQMEKDLGTDLEWVAAEHRNTEHPHVHVVIR